MRMETLQKKPERSLVRLSEALMANVYNYWNKYFSANKWWIDKKVYLQSTE